jgi:hypothetical protein
MSSDNEAKHQNEETKQYAHSELYPHISLEQHWEWQQRQQQNRNNCCPHCHHIYNHDAVVETRLPFHLRVVLVDDLRQAQLGNFSTIDSITTHSVATIPTNPSLCSVVCSYITAKKGSSTRTSCCIIVLNG